MGIFLILFCLLIAGCDRAEQGVVSDEEALEFDITEDVSSPLGSFIAAYYGGINKDIDIQSRYYVDITDNDIEELPLPVLNASYEILLTSGRLEDAYELALKLYEKGLSNFEQEIMLSLRSFYDGDYAKSLAFLPRKSADKRDLMFSDLVVDIIKAWSLFLSGDVREAKNIFASLPREDNPNFHLAIVAEIQDRHTSGFNYYKRALKESDYITLGKLSPMYNYLISQGRKGIAMALKLSYLSRFEGQISKVDNILNEDDSFSFPLNLSHFALAADLLDKGNRSIANNHPLLALRFARYAQVLYPSNLQSHMLSALSMLELGYSRQAIKEYEKIPISSPWRQEILHILGSIYLALGDYQKVVDLFSAQDNVYAEGLGIYADALLHLERYEESIDLYTRALGAGGKEDNRGRLLYSRGIAYERNQSWELAEKDFLAALQLNDGDAQIMNYLGYSWVERGENLFRAKRILKEALDLSPHSPHIIDSYGWALYALGEYEEAVKFLEEAARYMPYDAIINDHLASALFKVGRQKEAVFMWQRILDFGQDEELRDKIREKFREQGNN